MIWNLVALIFAGVGAAGIGLILRMISRKKLPKWIVPVCAGIGMLSYQIHSEYSWIDHKRSQLPANAEVIETHQDKMLWRPWTYISPLTVGFTVLDTDNIKVSRIEDDQIAEFQLYRFERQGTDKVTARPHLLNCSNGQLLQLTEERKPELNTLKQLPLDNPLRTRLCNG